MKKSVAYCRMSTDQQEHSIESQLRLIKDYALRNGYLITEVYKDEGISGRQAEKRPAFLQMIDDSAKGDFQSVLIYDSSRFARNLEQSIVYKSILKKNQVELISITEPTLDEDTSLITDALFGAMNEMYSRKLSKNVKRGLEQKALRGEYIASPPFGYCYEPGTTQIIVDAEKAGVVRYIFEQYQCGRGTFVLAKELNERGIMTRTGHKIDTRQIQYILTNPAYKGFLRIGINGKSILKKCNIPVIIEPETFDATQELVKTNLARHKPKERPPESKKHWLSGLLRCSECGQVFCFAKGCGGRADRFRCSGVPRGTCRATTTITVVALVELVVQGLQSALCNPQILYEQQLITITPTVKPDYDIQLKRLNQSLERAKMAYLEEIDTLDEYKQNKNRITLEIQAIEKKRQEESAPTFDLEAFIPKLENVISFLQSAEDFPRKQAVARSIISFITIDAAKKKVCIYFCG